MPFGTAVRCEACTGELSAVWNPEKGYLYECRGCSRGGVWKEMAKRLHPGLKDRQDAQARRPTSSTRRR